ncbi:DNA polymerase III subunit gamma/tau [Bacillaceae bacterium SIJ1]|uniref:DNA polymerase III subunit gamma/tau n=1 Tax=Litoribacterium kuwaitense TaxID=1398745 RepID=UPI0013ECD242|nr:DNA polymerase III subunit gamma/tau [Litoribacterium kuwaitense]NGP46676.1 DNA polymerase III subunit gamma/tau [Litoribacterium kuwaitense]
MSYQALYRAFRPQRFADVAGQEHLTTTLQNALEQKKFSHAYVFSGPRGTGKTTAAKIMAKAINCEQAPAREPCNQCSACQGIMDGSISDVIEIDAASNNGVDEIRDIRDKVKYAPSAVSYKVYIIDEVHMLSTGAFNALLKTLEEPPQHVLFILATTEPHKIPTTILSRCQRFEFKRMTMESLVARMNYVLQEMNMSADDTALKRIGRAAEGGMRDALSLLDQAISFSDGHVSDEAVMQMTGMASADALFSLVSTLHAGETASLLNTLEDMVSQGKEPQRILEDLIYFFRDVLLYKKAPAMEEFFQVAEAHEPFKEFVQKASEEWILHILHQLNESQNELKWSGNARVMLEVALLRLPAANNDLAVSPTKSQEIPEVQADIVSDLHKKIAALEKELAQVAKRQAAAPSVEAQAPQQKKRVRGQQLKVPTAEIQRMLASAEKKELQQIKNAWADVMEHIKREKISAHATLISSEPVAASEDAFLLAFKYDIHCQMVADNKNQVCDIIEDVLQRILGKTYRLLTVPQKQWQEIREEFIRTQREHSPEQEEADEEPIIAEAKKIVPEEWLEIKS